MWTELGCASRARDLITSDNFDCSSDSAGSRPPKVCAYPGPMAMAPAAPQPAGGTSFASLDQRLSYNVRGQPRAVFTRVAMGGDRATDGELGCFEMPLIHGAKLHLGRFDPQTDGPGRKDKFVLSMADRRGISRTHGWLECHDGRFLVVWPVTEKEGFPTWVNGEPIKGQTSLRTGDWLGFGAMHGKPIVEFDCTILVNTSPQKSPRTLPEPREAKVTTPVAKPPAPPGPVASGQARYSTSRTPDALRNGQSSSFDDYELSTDWAPQADHAAAGSDDELRTDQPPRSHSYRNASAVLERAQRQLAETKLELQQKEYAHEKEVSARTSLSREAAELRAAHQKEASARTSLSKEAAELRAAHQKEASARASLSKEAARLRGEIATLRAFLAEQAADQVFLSPPDRPATFSEPPPAASPSEPASPRGSPGLKGTTKRTTSADSAVQDAAAPIRVQAHATVVQAHTTREMGVVQEVAASRVKAHGTASRLAAAGEAECTDTDTMTSTSTFPQEEEKVREPFPRDISPSKGLSELLKDTQANFRRVSDALKQLPDAGGERASTTEDTAGASGPTPWKKLAEMARSGKDGKRNRLGCLAGFKVHGW